MTVRMRHTRAHTANRRSHHKITAPAIIIDKDTGSPALRHHIDMNTGMYNGRKVLDITKKAEKALTALKAE